MSIGEKDSPGVRGANGDIPGKLLEQRAHAEMLARGDMSPILNNPTIDAVSLNTFKIAENLREDDPTLPMNLTAPQIEEVLDKAVQTARESMEL